MRPSGQAAHPWSAETLAQTALSLYIHIVSTFDFAKLIVQLAAEFKRRDMRAHVALLRPYYRSFQERRRAALREPKPPWTEELVIEWLCILQIPPFENVLPTLATGARACGCDVKEVGLAMISCVYPGGRVRECKGCGARWLERTSAWPDRTRA